MAVDPPGKLRLKPTPHVMPILALLLPCCPAVRASPRGFALQTSQISQYRHPEVPPANPQTAHVTWIAHQLTVDAENSSLLAILRQIAALTGMKITGSLADERVFGTYGPAPAAAILTQLLDGSGTNLLIVQGEQPRIRQLVLSPRNGQANLPFFSAGPGSGTFTDLPPQLPQHKNPAPPTSPDSPAKSGSIQTTAPTNGTQPPALSNVQSPNGVRTPEQFFGDSKQAGQPTPSPTGTTQPQP